MAEYIERDAAVSEIARIAEDSDMPDVWYSGMSVAMSAVCRIPSANVVPVRHGRWKPMDRTFGRSVYYCSVCEQAEDVPTAMGVPMFTYCPNCGARMDGDGDV